MNKTVITTIEVDGVKYPVYTLDGYNTAYYYAERLGSMEHFDTIKKLINAIKRFNKRNPPKPQ